MVFFLYMGLRSHEEASEKGRTKKASTLRSGERGPEAFERDEIAGEQIFPGRFGQGGMIEPSGELLERRLVEGTRPAAAEIATDDLHFFAQHAQGPKEIGAGEATAFPIRDGLSGDEAIEVDGDVNLVVMIVIQPIHEHRFPIADPQRIEVGGIADPFLPPGINEELVGFGRVPVAEQPGGEIALEIGATPDADALHLGIFEGAIDPRAAGPVRRADVPVGMVVEGEEGEGLAELAHPDGAQMMEIAGTGKREGAEFGGVLRGEGIDLRRRGDEAESLGFLADVDPRQGGTAVCGDEIPGVIRLETDLIGRHDWGRNG